MLRWSARWGAGQSLGVLRRRSPTWSSTRKISIQNMTPILRQIRTSPRLCGKIPANGRRRPLAGCSGRATEPANERQTRCGGHAERRRWGWFIAEQAAWGRARGGFTPRAAAVSLRPGVSFGQASSGSGIPCRARANRPRSVSSSRYIQCQPYSPVALSLIRTCRESSSASSISSIES
jgi:hypothetical protein